MYSMSKLRMLIRTRKKEVKEVEFKQKLISIIEYYTL